MLGMDSHIQRKTDIIAAEAGKDVVMINLENGNYYAVSGVARHIWDLIQEPMSVSQVITALASVYEVDRSSCEEDTLTFLHTLFEEHLIYISRSE